MLDEAADDSGELLPESEEGIRAAVEHERKLLWENQPVDEAKTELGKEIVKRMGVSGIVADDYGKKMGKTILKSKLGEKGKPNYGVDFPMTLVARPPTFPPNLPSKNPRSSARSLPA